MPKIPSGGNSDISETVSRSELYREIVPIYFAGGIRPGLIEAVAVNVRLNSVEDLVLKKPRKAEHIEEACIKFTPQQAKSFAIWLLSNIKTYEEKYGKIITDDCDKRIDDILENFMR